MTITCPVCDQPLYPRLARRTDQGWAHVACPIQAVPIMRCDGCHHAVAATAGGTCAPCEREAKTAPIALTGGAWVLDGLVHRWRTAS